MLLTRQDVPVDHEELRSFLHRFDFGQLVAPGAGEQLPVIVPTHFLFRDTSDTIVELHLHRQNPVWVALGERPTAIMAVTGASAYIPTYWNADAGDDPAWTVPTSYYAAVQLTGTATIIDDPAELGSLLNRQLAHHQPEGGYGAIDPGTPYARLLRGVRGLRMDVDEVRVKFKFGANRDVEHRRAIAQHLRRRDLVGDSEVRGYVLRRT